MGQSDRKYCKNERHARRRDDDQKEAINQGDAGI